MNEDTEEDSLFFDIEPSSTIFVTVIIDADDDSRIGVFTTGSKPVLPEVEDTIELSKTNVEDVEHGRGLSETSDPYRVVDREIKYTSVETTSEKNSEETSSNEGKNGSKGTVLGTGIMLHVESVDE